MDAVSTASDASGTSDSVSKEILRSRRASALMAPDAGEVVAAIGETDSNDEPLVAAAKAMAITSPRRAALTAKRIELMGH